MITSSIVRDRKKKTDLKDIKRKWALDLIGMDVVPSEQLSVEKVLAHHRLYFAIASERLSEALSQGRKLQDLKLKPIEAYDELEADIQQSVVVSVVFAALTAEAFINHYAFAKLTGSYFKNYLDKLDLRVKWIVIPRLVTGQFLDPGSQPIQRLAHLVKLRNDLVHYKTIDITREEMFSGSWQASPVWTTFSLSLDRGGRRRGRNNS